MSPPFDYSQRSDGELLRAAAEGDEQAYWEFCVRSLPTLLRFVRARCQKHGLPLDLAADAVHEAMVRAIGWIKKHPGARLTFSWLVQTATNVIVDWLRERRHEVTGGRVEIAAASETLGRTDDALDLRANLERLPPPDKEILEKIYFRGLSPEEVSADLGLGKWAVYKRLERALDRLRSLMGPPSSSPPSGGGTTRPQTPQ